LGLPLSLLSSSSRRFAIALAVAAATAFAFAFLVVIPEGDLMLLSRCRSAVLDQAKTPHWKPLTAIIKSFHVLITADLDNR
jgi:hypothetical protein